MAGSLPHPARQEFALTSNSAVCRGQVHPQAAPFPVLHTVCGAYPLNGAQARLVLWCLLPASPQLCAPGSSMQHNRG